MMMPCSAASWPITAPASSALAGLASAIRGAALAMNASKELPVVVISNSVGVSLPFQNMWACPRFRAAKSPGLRRSVSPFDSTSSVPERT
jgi:hypothetical protein